MADKGLTLTQKRIQNNKIFVYVCLVLSLAFDIAVFVMLVANALPFKYWIVAILFAVFDLGFLAVSLASNFRFGYFRPHLVFYGIALIALSVIAVLVGVDSGNGTAYTTLALIAYPVMHLVTVIAVIIAVVFSIKSGTKSKAGGLLITLAMLAVSAVYGILLVENGYFGQPLEENRALLYSYNENYDGYAVVGVEKGSGTKIVIPDEFNGKKVYAVDCAVFNAEGIKKAELNCAANVIFDNEDELNNISDSLTLYVDKQNYDTVRNRFYAFGHERAVKNMAPGSLDKDEVFVSFAFPMESDSGKLYPTWYGKKGDTLNLGADAPEWYNHYDLTNDDDLYYAFSQNDASIFIGFYDNGSNVDRRAVSKSCQNLVPKFDKVFGLTIGNGNDDAYTMPQWFRCSRVNGEYDIFRYVALSTADSFLETAPTRTGFSLMWKGNFGMFSESIPSLSEYLNACSGNGATVIPVWNLDAPTVSEIVGYANPTYGDTLALSATASHTLGNIDFEYKWYLFDDELEDQTTNALEIDNIGIDKGGSYRLEVRAYSKDNSVTTLSSTAQVFKNVTVQKRDLHFTWNVGESAQYTAEDIALKASYTSSDVINSDPISFTESASSVRNAGTYNLSVSLYGDCAYKYNAVGAKTFTVTPAPLTIKADDKNKPYDGTAFSSSEFTYNEEGLKGSDSLGTAVYTSEATSKVDAGKYDIFVAFPDATEVLKNYSYNIDKGAATIEKRTVTVTWESDTALTYSGEAQHPAVQSIDVVERDRDGYLNYLTYSGAKVNAGDGYTAEVSFRDGSSFINNYTLNNTTCGYSIKAKDITLAWSETTFTYNGMEQYPTVVSADVVDSDKNTYLSNIEYDGKQIDAGQSHTVTAAFKQGSGFDTNYNIVNGGSCGYVINAKSVTVTWVRPDFIYNGMQQKPEISSVVGTVPSGDGIDISSDITVSVEGGTYAGDYTATATLNESVKNYVFAEPQTYQYSIDRKTVRLTWSTISFIYNGEKQVPEVTAVQDTIGSDGETVMRNITVDIGSGDTGIEFGNHVALASFDLNVVKNYTLDSGTRVCAYRIERRDLSLDWTVDEYTYNGYKQLPSLKIKSGLVSRDSAESILAHIDVSLTSGDGISAGSHTVTATAKLTLINYKIADGATCTYTINAAPLTITWCGPYFIYNGYVHLPSLLDMQGSVPGGESVSMSDIDIVLTNGDGISAGNHTATAVLNERVKNYVLTGSNLSISYDIEKATITLTWDYYGDPEFSRTGSPIEVVPTNVLPQGVRLVATYYSLDDNPDSPLQGAPTDEGRYKVVYSLDGENAGNYQIENPEKEFTIKEREEV